MAQAIAAKYSRIILQKRCKNETENCSICLESLYMKPVMYLPCKHFFHQTCLNQAFEKKLYTCPLCRSLIFNFIKKVEESESEEEEEVNTLVNIKLSYYNWLQICVIQIIVTHIVIAFSPFIKIILPKR